MALTAVAEMPPDGGHDRVELASLQSLERHTQILAIDDKAERTLVHVERDEELVRHQERFLRLEYRRSVLCATGCRWKVILSSSFTNTFSDRSSEFHECLSCVSRGAGGMSSRTSSRAGRWNRNNNFNHHLDPSPVIPFRRKTVQK
uniref:Uncharacterized protein n=1 Tax=Anopheles farauti TaxID=69004 RepID=A0A182QLY1_9DIPT